MMNVVGTSVVDKSSASILHDYRAARFEYLRVLVRVAQITSPHHYYDTHGGETLDLCSIVKGKMLVR